ncbi:hypothetical protein [Aeromicrobium terrae]|uniref:DUF4386 family protein n=1 Tax=Aeromicrobium terrae TaxID=2498846 RepID=A0A5C8NIY8_9ACTN|nr:hypothetical protein [Aeromicrobium terrae]TXL58046.1 hypothetical protein FHP06_12035 [Aeromicrobium terrae]
MTDASTVVRVRLLAVVLAVTAIATVPGGVLWPDTSTGEESYAFSDVEPIRQTWFAVLLAIAVVAAVNVPAQALVTVLLVRARGAAWATWGAALMWVGIALQAAGAAFLAGAYYFPTDPSVPRSAGEAVFSAAADDQGHLYGVLVAGALTVVVGTVLQVVGLFRARVVRVWVPLALLFSVLTFLVPGNGVVGLVTSLPMAAGSVALAWCAWRMVD